MNEKQTVVDVINTFSKPVYAQIELAESIASGSVLASVSSAHALLTNLLQAIDEQYNLEMDEHDALVESVEGMKKRIADLATAGALLTSARDEALSRIAEAELQRDEAVSYNAELKGTIDNLNARIKLNTQQSDGVNRELAKELKRLKDLEPDKLRTQLAESKKKLAEKQQDVNAGRTEAVKLRTENASLKSKNAAMVQAVSEMTEHVEYLKNKLDRISGTVSPKYYESPNGHDLFYVNTFGWGLDTRAMNPDCTLMRGLDFHCEVRTNSGICLLVSIDRFGAPVFPTVPGFEKAWPEGLTEDIQSKIMELLLPTHPEVVARYEWATGVDVTQLPIEAKHQEALVNSGMHNLFDVVHRTPEELEARVSGFGNITAMKVRSKCLDIVKEWDASYFRKEKVA